MLAGGTDRRVADDESSDTEARCYLRIPLRLSVQNLTLRAVARRTRWPTCSRLTCTLTAHPALVYGSSDNFEQQNCRKVQLSPALRWELESICMTKKGRGHLALWLLCLALAAHGDSGADTGPTSNSIDSTQWTLIGGNPSAQHFSSLAKIVPGNVGKLGLAWSAEMPTADGLTGVPLIAQGVVYQSGGLGQVWAHDARTGKLLWSYDAGIKFPMGLVPSWGSRLSRGLAVWEDRILKATGDCRLIALDRISGRLIWEVSVCDPKEYKTITAAPRVGGGKVFIGNSNADTGVGRGYVDAYDISTGRRLWRFHTIPGDPSKGFENPAMEMASKTWGKDYWKLAGGGSAWEGITYDSVTNLVYVGTDGASPFDPSARGVHRGDELFTNAIVALEADTGKYVWHYSTTPEDGWNYAATMPLVLADLPIEGKSRHVVMSAPKNGYFYVLDARTGKLVNEPKAIIPINWSSGIDMTTGRPKVNPDARYWLKDKKESIVSPSPMGAHNWMPMSYSPLTGLVYIPTMDMPVLISKDVNNVVGSISIDFYYAQTHGLPFKGSLVAWDPIKQRQRWQHDIGLPYQGGVLSTGGNLVFQGTTEGEFVAYRADTGEKLWAFKTGSGILGAASTIELDGKQMILVAAGSGTTAAVGFAPGFSGAGGGPSRLLAFVLDGNATLPKHSAPPDSFEVPPAPRPTDPSTVARGMAVWSRAGCELCHGFNVIGGAGSVRDLRRMSPGIYAAFENIVRGGAFKDLGMPVFDDIITADDIPAIKAYIINEAWRAYDSKPSASPP